MTMNWPWTHPLSPSLLLGFIFHLHHSYLYLCTLSCFFYLFFYLRHLQILCFKKPPAELIVQHLHHHSKQKVLRAGSWCSPPPSSTISFQHVPLSTCPLESEPATTLHPRETPLLPHPAIYCFPFSHPNKMRQPWLPVSNILLFFKLCL